MAGECEHPAGHDVERGTEARPQQAARAMQPGLHRGFGHLETGRRFGDTQPLDVAQDEHRTVAVGQRIGRGLERDGELADGDLVLRARRARRQPGRVLAERRLPSATALPRQRLVERDPREPGR